MGKIVYQKDSKGNRVYPVTIGDAVAVNGRTLTDITKEATTSKSGIMSKSDKSKLDGIAAGAQVNTVTSVAGKTGDVTLAKSDVGLDNVENTALSTWSGSSNLTTTKQGTLASASTKTAGSAVGNVPLVGTALGKTDNVPVVTDINGKLKPHASGALGTAAFTASTAYATAAQGTKADKAVPANTAITGATKCKITYDSKGLVTGGDNLEATDIPNLDASKITSGSFSDDRIASAATWNAKQNALTFTYDYTSGTKPENKVIPTEYYVNEQCKNLSDNIESVGNSLEQNVLSNITGNINEGIVTKDTMDAAIATAVSGASNYLGVIGNLESLATYAKKGDFYRFNKTNVAYTGLHNGDLIIANKDNPTAPTGTNLPTEENWVIVHGEADTDTTYTLSTANDKITIKASTASQGIQHNITVTKVNGHSVLSDVPANAVFTDTTYQSKDAASGGTDVSLVTTGEKYTWNNKQNALTFMSTPTSTNKVATKAQIDAVNTTITNLNVALTNNTTTYDDSKIEAIIDVAAADTTIQ